MEFPVAHSSFGLGSMSQLPVLQGEVAAVQQAMQKRVEDAVADARAQSATLRESREKNVHFSARVVALNSRVAQLTKQVQQHAMPKNLLGLPSQAGGLHVPDAPCPSSSPLLVVTSQAGRCTSQAHCEACSSHTGCQARCSTCT